MTQNPWWKRPSPEDDAQPIKEQRARVRAFRGQEDKPEEKQEASEHGEDQGGAPKRRRRRGKRNGEAAERPDRSGPKLTGSLVLLCDVEAFAEITRNGDESAADTLERFIDGAEPVSRRAYVNGNRFSRIRRALEDLGFEPVDVGPSRPAISLRIAVDAVELALGREARDFFIITHDPDMLDLLDKLRGYGASVRTPGSEVDSSPKSFDATAAPPATATGNAKAATEEALAQSAAGGETRAADAEDAEDHRSEEPQEPPETAVRAKAPAPRTRGRRRRQPAHESRVREPEGEAFPVSRDDEEPDQLPVSRKDTVHRPPTTEVGEDPFARLLLAIARVSQEPGAIVWGSKILCAMQEDDPETNERTLGFPSFDAFLEEARKRGLVELRREPRTDSYIVSWYQG